MTAAAPASQPTIDNRLFVLILQHPQERNAPLGTAAATRLLLRRADLVVGLSWPNLRRLVGRPVEPRRWGVLYLGSVRPAGTREVLVVDRRGEPVADPDPILRNLEGVVLLDGSWKEAKTLWWRNPWLLGLHRLVLNPPRPSRYGRLRREPRREAVSTLEAVALLLERVEGRPDAAAVLLTALDRLLREARPAERPAVST